MLLSYPQQLRRPAFHWPSAFMSLHSSLLFVADVLISLEIWEILLHWPDTGSHLSQRLIVVTFSIFRSEVECCYNWTLLFDVVQQVLYDWKNCKAILGPVIENVYKTLYFMLALDCCSRDYCADMPASSPPAVKRHSSVLCIARAETSLASPLWQD